MTKSERALLGYTTEVEPRTSIEEITGVLVGMGASAITVEFDPATREPAGVRFEAAVAGRPQVFRLPARPDRVLEALRAEHKARRVERRHATSEQARRVAWRLVLRWVEVQAALVKLGQAELGEVMLPYLMVNAGATMWESTLKQIESKKGGRDD